MLQDFQNILVFNLTFERVITSLFVALICGFIVSVFYRLSYRGVSYSGTMANSLIALSMITSIVIMVIGNNLARAFGLVGAMSIIRFRTAVKDTQDIVFIFFALAVGMASGVEFYGIALTGATLIGLVIFVLSKARYGIPAKKDFLLQFIFETESRESPYLKLFDEFCRKYHLVNVRSLGAGNGVQLSYFVRLKNKEKILDFIQALKSIEGVSQVNLFFDEEEI
jgi:uncharacterized membrane protein YhiD involved in acid resistance